MGPAEPVARPARPEPPAAQERRAAARARQEPPALGPAPPAPPAPRERPARPESRARVPPERVAERAERAPPDWVEPDQRDSTGLAGSRHHRRCRDRRQRLRRAGTGTAGRGGSGAAGRGGGAGSTTTGTGGTGGGSNPTGIGRQHDDQHAARLRPERLGGREPRTPREPHQLRHLRRRVQRQEMAPGGLLETHINRVAATLQRERAALRPLPQLREHLRDQLVSTGAHLAAGHVRMLRPGDSSGSHLQHERDEQPRTANCRKPDHRLARGDAQRRS